MLHLWRICKLARTVKKSFKEELALNTVRQYVDKLLTVKDTIHAPALAGVPFGKV